MDITRNWRLKTSRSQLVATRCPVTGAVILPQQVGTATEHTDVYTFDTETVRERRTDHHEVEYARAAR